MVQREVSVCFVTSLVARLVVIFRPSVGYTMLTIIDIGKRSIQILWDLRPILKSNFLITSNDTITKRTLTAQLPRKTCLFYLSHPYIRATCPTHLIILDFISRTIFGEQYRSLSSSLCNFLHSPVTPSLLAPNILLNTLFSNTLSLCSSLNVSDQVLHPYKTTGKIIVLYIFPHTFQYCPHKIQCYNTAYCWKF